MIIYRAPLIEKSNIFGAYYLTNLYNFVIIWILFSFSWMASKELARVLTWLLCCRHFQGIPITLRQLSPQAQMDRLDNKKILYQLKGVCCSFPIRYLLKLESRLCNSLANFYYFNMNLTLVIAGHTRKWIICLITLQSPRVVELNMTVPMMVSRWLLGILEMVVKGLQGLQTINKYKIQSVHISGKK